MQTKATAGLKPCVTTEELSDTTTAGCSLCEGTADGYDAAYGSALCTECADAFGEFYSNNMEGRDE
jgi:hypothetical protein